MNITNTLRENGYPDKFITKNLVERKPKEPITTVEKKQIFIRLPFKSDAAAEIINRKLHQSLKSTFTTATLRSRFTTTPVLNLSLKDKVPAHDHSMLVYSFSCCCSEEYVGRTTRRLSERIKEHHPVWLRTGSVKTIRSSVVEHLVNTNHQINPDTAFRIVYTVPSYHTNGVRQQILATAESIAIRLRNPNLCSQKQFIRSLSLPWPKFTPQMSTHTHAHSDTVT